MATLADTQAQAYALLRTLIVNPGFKFLSQLDETNALNAAALFVSSKVGGIHYVDTSLATIVGTADYTVPDTIFDIRFLELVDTSVTPNKVLPVDVVQYELFRTLHPDNADLGTNSDGTFAYFDPERHLLHIEPAPTQTGLVVRMLCYGHPNVIAQAGALYDGNVDELTAICHEAASYLMTRKGEANESTRMHRLALEYIEGILEIKSQRNQVKRIQVYRHIPPTRLRQV